ncbi:hypothetical protein ES703_19141 [subsurface metagenome]
MYKKEKLGRNNPCHCGSGKKYKKCHLESDLREGKIYYKKMLSIPENESTLNSNTLFFHKIYPGYF